MKTLYVLTFAAMVVIVSTFQEEDYDTVRDVENEFQDYFTNRVNERREKLRSLFDPNCLVWTRRNRKCFNGKRRSFDTRQVSYESQRPGLTSQLGTKIKKPQNRN